MDLIRDIDYVPADSMDTMEEVPVRGESLRLYSPMKVQCNGWGHEVHSPLPITIGQVTVWSASPIRIIRHALPGRKILIESAASLGSAFAEGWMKLPMELKEEILAHNLVSATSKGYIEYETYCAPWDFGVLLHHLRCTPEIAALSRQVYYKRNVFVLEPEGGDGYMPGMCKLMYPRPSVGELIRYIEFRCTLGTPEIQKLEYLSQRQYGFTNLKYLKLKFDASLCLGGSRVDFGRWVDIVLVDRIELPCKGEMEVVGQVTRRILQDGRSKVLRYLPLKDAERLRKIDSTLRPLFHFGGNESRQSR